MKIQILDIKTVKGKTWILGKGKLMDYLSALRDDFFEFSVQRRIVNNAYLDHIYDSVISGAPFPPITLTYQDKIDCNSHGAIELDEKKVEILDGLQRTYRLWVILSIKRVIDQTEDKSLKAIAKTLKEDKEGSIIIQNSFVTPKLIKKLLEIQPDNKSYIDILMECYSSFDIYFNIWTQQDDSEVVHRMLLLNAGQKQVSSTHQFELLFLHFFEDQKLNYNQNVTLVREKDARFRKVQRGKRQKGEFLMSSIVIALQSFINGRQLRIATVNKINLDDNKLLNHDKLEQYFNAEALSVFINCVYKLGDRLRSDSKDKSWLYIKWYGKDTTLSGIFGAMGSFLLENKGYADVNSIDELIAKITAIQDPFQIDNYYEAYNSKVASSQVNVGNVIRKAIFNYTKDLLNEGNPDWDKYFERKKDDDEE